MEPLPVLRPGRYRHFKGNAYELLTVARHSETLEPMVVYRALSTGRAASGCVLRPCGVRLWSGTAIAAPGLFTQRMMRRLTDCRRNIF